MKKTLFACLSILTLSHCASISTVSTNLDKENFRHYFSPTKVKIYQNESQFNGKYQFLTGVEGESCQAKPHLAEPNKIDARTNARRIAYNLGANAIVFTGCTTVSTKFCHQQLVCYGKAFQVANNDDNS